MCCGNPTKINPYLLLPPPPPPPTSPSLFLVMPALESSAPDRNFSAPDFRLPATDGATYERDRLKGELGLLIAFLCNHCPYVKAVINRFVADANEAQKLGVGVAGIMSNDTQAYPQDSFENMEKFAKEHAFSFPYLYDATQETARAFDAVCTPDFFLFDSSLSLVYRGRLDSAGAQRGSATDDIKRELLEAVRALEEGRSVVAPDAQFASIGCSIKWRKG